MNDPHRLHLERLTLSYFYVGYYRFLLVWYNRTLIKFIVPSLGQSFLDFSFRNVGKSSNIFYGHFGIFRNIGSFFLPWPNLSILWASSWKKFTVSDTVYLETFSTRTNCYCLMPSVSNMRISFQLQVFFITKAKKML